MYGALISAAGLRAAAELYGADNLLLGVYAIASPVTRQLGRPLRPELRVPG